jgi:hypothetical protein
MDVSTSGNADVGLDASPYETNVHSPVGEADAPPEQADRINTESTKSVLKNREVFFMFISRISISLIQRHNMKKVPFLS